MADEFDADLDVASILVPVNLLSVGGAIVSITAGGVELAEDSTSAWNAGTTYTIGQQVHVASTHRVYESLKDGNLNKDPTVLANQTTAAGVGTWWLDVKPTNRAAMFDGQTNTQTVAASPLVITLDPGAMNGFALFNLDADTMSAVVTDGPGGAVVYEETDTALEGSMPGDWYEYFFDRFKPLRQLVRTDIEPFNSARFVLTLTAASGTVRLGMQAVGDMRPIGIPQRDASVDPQDFSYDKQDAYGNVVLKKRGNATGMTISAVMEVEEAGSVLDTIKEVLGTPVVVVGSKAALYEWMTVFGRISARMAPVPYPDVTVNITVKGLL